MSELHEGSVHHIPPPLVTVVTATWKRPKTILEHALPSIDRQTYSPIEHLIVIDGQDPGMVRLLRDNGYDFTAPYRRLACLGRNWSQFSGDGGAGATCRMVGAWMATGEYITYLDDDNDYLPGHIQSMVDAIEQTGSDFITSSWMYAPGAGPAGSAPPGVGRTDTSGIMHRAMVLKAAGGFALDGYEGDGRMVERWCAAGLTWHHKLEPTYVLNYYRHGAPD